MSFSLVTQVAYVLLLVFILCFHVVAFSIYYQKWRKAILLLGGRTALKLSLTNLRLSLQGPFLQVLIKATPVGVVCILVCSYWFFSWWNRHSLDLWFCLWVLTTPLAVLVLATQLLPPSSIFLASSNPRSLLLIESLQTGTLVYIVSFLDVASLIHDENLRTRHGNWEKPVLDMINQVPLVFLDTRTVTRPLLQELQWVIQPGILYKTVFITDDEGGSPLLECWRPDWVAFSSELTLVSAGKARELIFALTKTRDSLPQPFTLAELPMGNLIASEESLLKHDASTPNKQSSRRLFQYAFYLWLVIIVGAINVLFGKTGLPISILVGLVIYFLVYFFMRKRSHKL